MLNSAGHANTRFRTSSTARRVDGGNVERLDRFRDLCTPVCSLLLLAPNVLMQRFLWFRALQQLIPADSVLLPVNNFGANYLQLSVCSKDVNAAKLSHFGQVGEG